MADHITTIPNNFRSGYVAVIGKPNAGKSTLLNQLLKYKLSIVNPQAAKPLAENVIGIHNEPGCQAVFMDTPGIIDPKYNLQAAMMKQVTGALKDADVIVFLVDCSDKLPKEDDLLALLKPVKLSSPFWA